ncbi:MAG: hypothetical protein U1F52_18585 [Burkholderiales bacterium]
MPSTGLGHDLPRLRTAWMAIGWSGVLIVAVMSLVPRPPELGIEHGDKVQHLLAYGSLMLWFAQVRVERGARRVTALALVAMGIGLEFAQGMTGYRTYSYADMAANTTGVILGWLAAPPRLPNAYRRLARRLAPPGTPD